MRNWRNEEATARTGSSCGNSGGKEMKERSGGGRDASYDNDKDNEKHNNNNHNCCYPPELQ